MKENSTTCHNALIEHQQKYGDEVLTENEKQFLYGVINYSEFMRRIHAWTNLKKSYCTQNNGDCSTCSLVNYGRDCNNNPVW
jgi:hypothetical protein